MANTVKILIGTAWLSSARVVECSIHLLNERNLQRKYKTAFLLKTRKTLVGRLIKTCLIYDFMTKLIIKILHYTISNGVKQLTRF